MRYAWQRGGSGSGFAYPTPSPTPYFPIAPLFLWVLAIIPYFHLPCPWPHYNLKRPFDPHMHVLVMWLSILESCQVYVVFVFMGALRVNSSLDT